MSKMHVDQDLIRDLAALLKETDLTEIEVADGDRKIKISRGGSVIAAPAAIAAPVALAAPTAATPADNASHPGAVKSPMVGTLYASSEPGADAFIKVGDTVTAGQTVFIVEAMKVMNQITAPKSGKVVAILVNDGQPVEFDEPLVIIE
jgi:acetyl-CoA carboxylase biotin carboxyl carrier protein